ncbi:MAG: phosphotransferase [Planctomycetota bacterium]|nr:phosphotransferase [Planctomycetota bacterium]
MDPGFSGASVWRVTTPQADWCLKGIPRADLDFDRQRGLHRLLRHLCELGRCPVAVPISGQKGTSLVELGEMVWQCEPWLPGEALREEPPGQKQVATALKSLAVWHESARGFQPKDRERTWFETSADTKAPGLTERLEVATRWTDTFREGIEWRAARALPPAIALPAEVILKAARESLRTVIQELESTRSLRTLVQPCLRDIWRPHVLFRGAEVTGLIDPQACRRDCVATDISRLLGSLCGNDSNLWETGLRSYEEVRTLTAVECLLVRTYDRSGCLLSGLWWVERFVESGPDLSPSMRQRGEQRLRHFAKRLHCGWPDGSPRVGARPPPLW